MGFKELSRQAADLVDEHEALAKRAEAMMIFWTGVWLDHKAMARRLAVKTERLGGLDDV